MALYTNTQRLTGLSGIDTETMITQLMKAESQKLYRLQRNSTKLTWKQEAYWTVADSLKTFQNKFLSLSSSSSLRLPSTFGKYNSSIKLNGADTKAVTVTATGDNASGRYELEITKLAAKHAHSGQLRGTIENSGTINAATIAELQANGGGNFTLNLDGTSKAIELTATDVAGLSNITDLENLIQAKADAAFGAGKIAVTSGGGKINIDPTGNGHTLTISEGTAVQQSVTAGSSPGKNASQLAAMLLSGQTVNFNIGGTIKPVTFQLTQPEIDEIDAIYTGGPTGPEDAMDALMSKLNAQMSANGISAGFEYDDIANEITLKSTGLFREDISISDDGGDTLMADLGFGATTTLNRTSTLAVLGYTNGDNNHLGANDLLKDVLSGVTFDMSGNYDIIINGKTITLNEDESVNDMMKKINEADAGVKMTYDKISQTFKLEAEKEGLINGINLDANATNALITVFGLTTETLASDAEFTLDGVATTRESNTFTVDGIRFTLNEVTAPGDKIEINVERDTSAIADIIIDFVNAYNDLIDGINGMVNENRAKSYGSYYEPLTQDEKKAMSESEIKDWETEAKKGLLYRDSILSGITADMRSQLYQSVTLSDGSKLALYQIGIETSDDYKEQGKLVVNEDKLNAAIEKYGEKIGELFHRSPDSGMTGSEKNANSGLAVRINNIVENAVSSSKGSISLKAGAKTGHTQFNNDLYNQLKTENDKISDMLKYLAQRENYYYSMFSKLEAAISSNDSQMNYLAQMFGY